MFMKTQNRVKINNLLGVGEYTTSEMFQLNPEISDVIFNTDLQKLCIYTVYGWQDMAGNPILQSIFFEDFETGNLSNWNVVNDNINAWIVGTADKYKGTYSAYISNDGINPGYTNNQTQISHIHREIIIPDTEIAKLELFWKGRGERNYDYGRIYLMPTSVVPQAHVLPNNNYLISGDLNQKSSFTKELIDLTAYKNTTQRLCITWRNDSSVGTDPAIIIDNIFAGYKP